MSVRTRDIQGHRALTQSSAGVYQPFYPGDQVGG